MFLVSFGVLLFCGSLRENDSFYMELRRSGIWLWKKKEKKKEKEKEKEKRKWHELDFRHKDYKKEDNLRKKKWCEAPAQGT
jgi:hypothetical protein